MPLVLRSMYVAALLGVAGLTVLLSVHVPVAAQGSVPPKNILSLSWYGRETSGDVLFEEGLRRGLGEHSGRVVAGLRP